MDDPAVKIKTGDCVWCRVVSPEIGGYLVTITPNDIEGFLPSHNPIEIGRVVPATFVCMNGERALLTFAFVMGTSARVQFSTSSEEENAFAVWADAYPHAIRLRRAVDLVMPAFNDSAILMKLDENSARTVFPSLESTKFTGCVKVFCQTRLSRAALLFNEGRAVGSVYTTKLINEPYPFDAGVKKMLEDVWAPETDAELEMYELPAELVLSMSALFLGYIDHRADDLSNSAYAEKMLAHFASCKGTACLSLLEESLTPRVLIFIRNGEFKGAYSIVEQKFSQERAFMQDLLEKDANCTLKAYILPDALTTESVRLGYSLSSAQFLGPAKQN